MIGAILGDIIGSRHEFHNIKTKDFDLLTPSCEFTDDTVMTCAVAQALIDCKGDYEHLSEKTVEAMHRIGRKYPNCGYGGMFFRWMFSDDPKPYKSFGNGAAMRVSPVGFIAKNVNEAKELSRKVTEITHNHPEGLKGAEATAVAIVMARQGRPKEEIKEVMERDYYKSEYSVDEYRKIIRGHGDETCQVSMPEALQCFYEGMDYEDVIRNCISIGGDSDTLAAIAGGIAEAYYGVPDELTEMLPLYLDKRLLGITNRFEEESRRGLEDRILADTAIVEYIPPLNLRIGFPEDGGLRIVFYEDDSDFNGNDFSYTYELDPKNASLFLGLISLRHSIEPDKELSLYCWLAENVDEDGTGLDLLDRWIRMGLHGTRTVHEDYPGGIHRVESF